MSNSELQETNIIYVGAMYPQFIQEDLLKIGSVVDTAGHTFQTVLLDGLDYYYPDMKVISSALTGSYPFPHKPFLLASYLLRKRISKLSVVVLDLPEYIGSKLTGIKALLKRIG